MNFQPDIVDGFTYRPDLVYNPSSPFIMGVGQLDTLRRAANYRPRWYTLPEEKNLPIAAFDTSREQIHLIPGSLIWGMMMTDGIDEAPPAVAPPPTPSVNQFRIFDEQASIAFQSDFRCFLTNQGVIVLAEPLLIVGDGLLNVEITNVSPHNANSPQLVLLVAEPCAPMEMHSTEC